MVKKKSNITEVPSSLIKGSKSRNLEYPSNFVRDNVDVTPRFLVISCEKEEFKKVSPFRIANDLLKLVGSLPNIRRTGVGLLIETANANQSTLLLRTKRLCDFDVFVAPHKSLNYSKGVVRCSELLNCTLDEVKDGLRSQGVIDVKNISTFVGGNRQPSPSFILTFNSPKLPQSIKAGYILLEVRPYIPSPLRCFRCQKFGHVASRCNNSQICVCGLPPHPESACGSSIFCINCGQEHSARSRDCPVYKEEAAIQRIKVMENISYPEARRKVKSSGVFSSRSFADVVAAESQPLPSFGNSVKDLAALLVPEVIRLLDKQMTSSERFKVNIPDSPSRSRHAIKSSTRAPSSSLSNPVPTSVLRRSASGRSGDILIYTPSSQPDCPSTAGKCDNNVELKIGKHMDTLIKSTLTSADIASPITSGTEGHSSVRERSSSGSSGSKPPRKKVVAVVGSLDRETDPDSDNDIFDITN